MKWLSEICKANDQFQQRIAPAAMPVKRKPCPYAIVTCMDPRINLQAAGIRPFSPEGELQSQVRIIRTLGGMGDRRSLAVGIHLAGFKEVAVIMHTDCGCSLAYQKIDTIIENMETTLPASKLAAIQALVGEPFRAKLIEWLGAFQDPHQAVEDEVAAIINSPFTPASLIVHGLVYDLTTGRMDIVVNGYTTDPRSEHLNEGTCQ